MRLPSARGPKWPLALAFLLWHCDSDQIVAGGECTAQKDCISGEVCVSGRCQVHQTAVCGDDGDCALGERCDSISGQCVPVASDAGPIDQGTPDSGPTDLGMIDIGFNFPDATFPDSSFPDASSIDAMPTDTGTPDGGVDTGVTDVGFPDTGVFDSGVFDVGFPDTGVPPTCSLDTDCGSANYICVNNACALRCNAPGGACPGTDACNPETGRCAPGNIGLGADCTFDEQCGTRLCLGLTIGTVSHSICTSACGAGSQCPLNFSCSDVSGMSFCLGENLSTPPATYDTIPGGFCSTTVNACQTGWCNTGASQCIETCSRNLDCVGFGGQCWTYTQVGGTITYDQLCYPGGGATASGGNCSLNDSCASGLCDRYDGMCAAHCCSDIDCPGAQSCAEYDLDATHTTKICVPRSPTTGTAVLGTVCTTFSECESEVCVPTNFNDAMSLRRCSTLCCRDADCGSLPLGGRCVPAGGAVPNSIVGVCQPN